VLFYLPQNGIKKIGFTATKKVGNAVRRNRAKRRLRALFLEYSDFLKDGTYIFVAKQSIVEATHLQVSKDFKKILTSSKSLDKDR